MPLNNPTSAPAIGEIEASIAEVGRFTQICPLVVNSLQSLTNAAADKDFVAFNTRGAQGLVSTLDAQVEKVFLMLFLSVHNTYAGTNALDCTTATHNQWQIALDAGAASDLVNGAVADGQMADNDWRIDIEGGSLGPPPLVFDVTAQVTNIDGNIGIRLSNGRAEQTDLQVTLSAYLKVIWKQPL